MMRKKHVSFYFKFDRVEGMTISLCELKYSPYLRIEVFSLFIYPYIQIQVIFQKKNQRSLHFQVTAGP